MNLQEFIEDVLKTNSQEGIENAVDKFILSSALIQGDLNAAEACFNDLIKITDATATIRERLDRKTLTHVRLLTTVDFLDSHFNNPTESAHEKPQPTQSWVRVWYQKVCRLLGRRPSN